MFADFFIQMDRAVGPLTLHSSLSHLVRYIRYGIRLLKESHWLLVWTLSTDCIFLLINKLPESETISHPGHRAGWRWLLVNISLCLSYVSRDRIYFPLWQSETLVIYVIFWKKSALWLLYVFHLCSAVTSNRQKNALPTFSIALHLPPTYPWLSLPVFRSDHTLVM